MPAYKIYKSGDNIEIYEYEYLTPPPKKYRVDAEPEEQTEQLENTEICRIKERREQTLRDNANGMKRMAREYFQGNNFFVTLTFKDNINDIDKTDRKLKYFIKKFREDYGETSFVAVRELQKRGAIHYHMLLKNKKMRDYYLEHIPEPKRKGNRQIFSQEQKDYQDYLRENYWKYGIVNCTLINFVDDVGAYLVKYMNKNKLQQMEWQENRRLILRSADIKKIEPLDSIKDSKLIDSIAYQMEYIKSIAKEDIQNNLTRKRVFTNGYKSRTHGQMLYYDMHLSRLNSAENQ